MSDLQKVMKPKKIEIYSDTFYGMPEKMIEFVEYFQDKLESIPEEYRESACVDIEAGDEYSSGSLKIYYMRPETIEEEKFRKEQEQNREDDNKRWELKKLVELQKKYGVK